MKMPTVIQRTATALLAVLKVHGPEVPQNRIDGLIQAWDGDPRYKEAAAKLLRDNGLPVATSRRGNLTVWYLARTGVEGMAYETQELELMFSQLLSNARSTAGMVGPGVRAARDKTKQAAIMVGGALGYSPDYVLNECKARLTKEQIEYLLTREEEPPRAVQRMLEMEAAREERDQ